MTRFDVDKLLTDFRRLNATTAHKAEALKVLDSLPEDPAKELCRAIPAALRRKGIPLRPRGLHMWHRVP